MKLSNIIITVAIFVALVIVALILGIMMKKYFVSVQRFSITGGTLRKNISKSLNQCKTHNYQNFWNIAPKLKQENNLIIVDVANTFTHWRMNNFGKSIKNINQRNLMSKYINFAKEHSHYFTQQSNSSLWSGSNVDGPLSIIYVIKNYKFLGPKEMVANKITSKILTEFQAFVSTTPNTYVALVEDYRKFPAKYWLNKKNHHLRGRDDFTCFYLSQAYSQKNKDLKSVIMTDDKFKDFTHFKNIPAFTLSFISPEVGISNKIQINPNRIQLGKLSGYNINPFYIGLLSDEY